MRTAFDCLLPAGGRVNRGVAGCYAKRGGAGNLAGRILGRGMVTLIFGFLSFSGSGQEHDMCGEFSNVVPYYPMFDPWESYRPWWLEQNLFTPSFSDSTLWQYGIAQKSMLNTFEGLRYVLVTDTINSYPSYETHNFELTFGDYAATEAWGYPGQGLHRYTFLGGCYQMETDSTEDWLSVEYSFDLGFTWHDLLNPEAFSEAHPDYSDFQIWSPGPVFQAEPFLITGTTSGQQRFIIPLALTSDFNPNVPSGFVPGISPIKFRISFSSGANASAKDGVMFSNIYCGVGIQLGVASEGMSQTKIWTGLGHLYVDLKESAGATMVIWDLAGRPVMNTIGLRVGVNETSIGHLAAGVYVYALTDADGGVLKTGKIVMH